MRPCYFAGLIVLICCPLGYLPGQPPPVTPDVFVDAEKKIKSLILEGEFVPYKSAMEPKIALAVNQDVAELKRYVGPKQLYDIAVKIEKRSSGPDSQKVEIAHQDQVELLVVTWIEYKTAQTKPDIPVDIKKVTADLEDFARVRFKSDPQQATVHIDGIARGQTTYQTYLSRKGSYEIKISKDGYEPWTKKDFTPTGRNDVFEEKLKKVP